MKSKLVLVILCTIIFTINSSDAALRVDFQLTGGPTQTGYTGVNGPQQTNASPFVRMNLSDPNHQGSNIALSISSSIAGNTIFFRDRGDSFVGTRLGDLGNLYRDFIRTGSGAPVGDGANAYSTMTLSFTGLVPSQQYDFTLHLYDPGIASANQGDYTYSITGTGDSNPLNDNYTINFSNTGVLTPAQLAGYSESFTTNELGALSITITQTAGLESTVPLNGLTGVSNLPAQRTVPPIPPVGHPIQVIIDADAKNEIDDQWAIALAILRLDRFKIEGFVGSQFLHDGKYPIRAETIPASVAEIELLMELAGAEGRWPIHAGSMPMTSMTEFTDSPGVDFIIERARAHTAEKPLWLIVLGAPTNAAAAWLKAPDIADKMIVFWHGRSEWPTKCQNFNAQGDPFATRVLFESKLPLVLFDTGGHLTVPMAESELEVKPHGAMGNYLHEARKPLWTDSSKGMFDLGDIAAMVDPSIGVWEVLDCPTVTSDLLYDFDNLNGKILRCSTVNRDATFEQLYNALEQSGGLVSIPAVLFDTDVGGDIDDAGALAVLHALAAKNEIRILGIGVSIGDPAGVPYVDAINTWYGRPNIPIGAVKYNPPYSEDFYMSDIVANYPHDLTESAAPEAYKLYRQILAEQPDSSVTLVTVGPATNIARLLASPPDEHSPLTGMELVRQKVVLYAAGGNGAGGLPNGLCGFNYRKDIPSAQYELLNMPIEVPMIFAGGSGPQVFTGNFYNSPSVDPSHIIRRSYDNYFSGNNWDRPSWDQLRLLYACRPQSRALFDTSAFGNITLASNQNLSWTATPNRNKAYAYVNDIPAVTAEIRELMLYSPYDIPPKGHAENPILPTCCSAKSSGWDTSGPYVYTRGFDGTEGSETSGASSE